LSPGTVTQRLTALRFFYIKTLKKTWSIAATPYPKRAFHLPSILSREEVARLIDAALTPYHRTLLMTLYSTGVRRAELTHLKISDIDSKRMVIHVQGGKGRKDRDVMLSPKLLEVLREHWRGLRHKTYKYTRPVDSVRLICDFAGNTSFPNLSHEKDGRAVFKSASLTPIATV
jgi:integrase